MPLYAITGSATVDGRPIYRDAAGGWTDQIQRAAVFEAEADRDAQVQAAQREERVVCDPYPIEVERSAEQLVPLRLKERIRAAGPTVA